MSYNVRLVDLNIVFEQLEKKNERGETLLQVAVIKGELPTAKRLIKKVRKPHFYSSLDM